jgi:hypothetical protein
MDGDTILSACECEVRRLPLNALEAFVLSQVDGRLRLGEISEVAGLDLVQTVQFAERLIELGAVSRPAEPKKLVRSGRPRSASGPERRPSRSAVAHRGSRRGSEIASA